MNRTAPVTPQVGRAGPRGDGGRTGTRPTGYPRTLLLGLGNDILGDDSVGLRVVRAIRSTHPERAATADAAARGRADLHIVESSDAGLALLDEISGYDEVFLVDAVQTGTRPPGHLHEVDGMALPRVALGSPHFLGVPETLALGLALGLPMPARITVFAIEVADPCTVSTSLTPVLEMALPGIVRKIGDRLPR